MKQGGMRTWSAEITRKASGTIEVKVDAASKEEAEARVKHVLAHGGYESMLVDAIRHNAECNDDEISAVVEVPAESGMREDESFAAFKDIVPRNPNQWFGGIVLYSSSTESFFEISFGTGDNLDGDDMDNGFDDYIMVDRYAMDGKRKLEDIIAEIKDKSYVGDETEGLIGIDGGQWLLRRKDWKDGDIRRFIIEALEFAGYKACDDPDDVRNSFVYICNDY